MEGWLLSVSLCRRSNTKKKRWFCIVGEYLLYFSSRADTQHSNAKPLSIIPLKNSTVVPYFKESNAQYKSTAYSVVGVHGICIKHAGREEARMLAFNRFELEEWIEALRSAAGAPSPLYKRGWGIDALMTSLNRHDDSTLWEVQGPGLVSTKAGEQTTVAILPPKKLLHRLDASCFMVTVTNDVGYLYELNVPEANEDGVYVCKYTPLLAGKYHLRVLVKHITFNPLPNGRGEFSPEIYPGETVPEGIKVIHAYASTPSLLHQRRHSMASNNKFLGNSIDADGNIIEELGSDRYIIELEATLQTNALFAST